MCSHYCPFFRSTSRSLQGVSDLASFAESNKNKKKKKGKAAAVEEAAPDQAAPAEASKPPATEAEESRGENEADGAVEDEEDAEEGKVWVLSKTLLGQRDPKPP